MGGEELLIKKVLEEIYEHQNVDRLLDMYEEFFDYKNIIYTHLKSFMEENTPVFVSKVCNIGEGMYNELISSYQKLQPYLEASLSVMRDCCQLNRVMSENKTMFTDCINTNFIRKLETMHMKSNFMKMFVDRNGLALQNENLKRDINNLRNVLVEKDKCIISLEENAKNKEMEINEKCKAMVESKDEEIETLNVSNKNKDALLESKDEKLETKNEEIATLQINISKLESQIKELQKDKSKSVKLQKDRNKRMFEMMSDIFTNEKVFNEVENVYKKRKLSGDE